MLSPNCYLMWHCHQCYNCQNCFEPFIYWDLWDSLKTYSTLLLAHFCNNLICCQLVLLSILMLILIIVRRGVLTSLLYEDTPELPTPAPFSNFVQLLPPFPVTTNPQTPLLILLSCFFGWMDHQLQWTKISYPKKKIIKVQIKVW